MQYSTPELVVLGTAAMLVLGEIGGRGDNVNPDDEANKPLFDQGLQAYLANLPAMPSIYTIYPFAYSQEYWTGWPTENTASLRPGSSVCAKCW